MASSVLASPLTCREIWGPSRRRQLQEPISIASHRFQVRVRCSLKNGWCTRLRHHKSSASSRIHRLACPRAVWPKDAAAAVSATTRVLSSYPTHVQCGAASAVIVYAIWGLLPSVQYVRRHVFQRREWDRSGTKRVVKSYIRPLLLWAAVLVICRAFDPVVLANERSQAIKERLLNFLRSLSTVLTFAFSTARLTQQVQKFMMERQTSEDARNLGVQFIGNAVSTSVWVAAVCLFMELLGFSTQKWLTAGGFGTVLLTLAGREIFTNFLSSVMIHATRPFVELEWIQTKIDGQDVSGTVELVGWWSPTIIRGEDREAVHIPNHKFTMSVVRNLTQKTHWRIKTHIGISHFDVNKINLIVADMRKVLSKHPQVEHKKLHRRVFFDFIDPVNQSLMIMVSCFVKTSHYEEYLSVKEIIMFNLLKVISYHNARLATPIRNIQRIYDEVETRNSPFRSVSREDIGRPLYLIDTTSVDSTPAKGTSKSLSNNVQESTAAQVPEYIVISGEEEREKAPAEESIKDRPRQDVSKALKASSSFKEKQNGQLKAPPTENGTTPELQERKEAKPAREVEVEKVQEKQDDVKSETRKEENAVLQHDVKVDETNGGEQLNPSVEAIKLKPLDCIPELIVANGVQVEDDPWKETADEAQADSEGKLKRVEGLLDPDALKVMGGEALHPLHWPTTPTD